MILREWGNFFLFVLLWRALRKKIMSSMNSCVHRVEGSVKNRHAVPLSSRFISWSVSLCSAYNTRYTSSPQGSTVILSFRGYAPIAQDFPRKFLLGAARVDFLGHLISSDSVQRNDD